MSDTVSTIQVEVAYAQPQQQRIIALSVPAGTTALEAVQCSGIAAEFPQIDPLTASMGIFSRLLDGRSQPLPKDCVLEEGDRVEIYRPLLIDPKQARLRRAARRE
ncbi:MAG: RnfH family protein [Gammaproteobacteria bacterium]|nr:RnfH family protein [Pseudomonadales bacterium]MCP5331688.1 RnfH family protein [Pseudomonadales bacterium]